MLYSQSIALIWHSISLDIYHDITEIPSDSEVKKLYFVTWHFFSSDSAQHLDTESNSRQMQPDAPSNQPMQPQTLAHFQSIGSTEVELPHTRQTQLCNQLSKCCLDVLWCFTPENNSLQSCNFRKHYLFPCESCLSHIYMNLEKSNFCPLPPTFSDLTNMEINTTRRVQIGFSGILHFGLSVPVISSRSKHFLSMIVDHHSNSSFHIKFSLTLSSSHWTFSFCKYNCKLAIIIRQLY